MPHGGRRMTTPAMIDQCVNSHVGGIVISTPLPPIPPLLSRPILCVASVALSPICSATILKRYRIPWHQTSHNRAEGGVGPAHQCSGRFVRQYGSYLFFCTYGAGNPMVAVTRTCSP